MNTKIIELRMAVRGLPTDNKDVQLAVKSEVLRLAELIDKQLSAQQSAQADEFAGFEASGKCSRCGNEIRITLSIPSPR